VIVFDSRKLVKQPNGGYLGPREDVAASAQCYVALDSNKQLAFMLQAFPDGTASYWNQPGRPATPARSLEDAFERGFVISATVSILTCPRCKSPFMDRTASKTGGQILKCKACGAVSG